MSREGGDFKILDVDVKVKYSISLLFEFLKFKLLGFIIVEFKLISSLEFNMLTV